ncbi:aldo/keto reductase [Parafrankia soli]|nr:aldo/keto reductase [Parafrankia soli]
MEYTRLGSSGLKISRIALGCMSFGKPNTGRDWALDTDAAEPIFRQAVELGITLWDGDVSTTRGSSNPTTDGSGRPLFLDIDLSDKEVAALEDNYSPRRPTCYGSKYGY